MSLDRGESMSEDFEKDWAYINKDKQFSHWSKRGERFYPTNVTHDRLPGAVYEAKVDGEGDVFGVKIDFPSDVLLDIPGTPTDYILSQIETFWKKRDAFKEIGLLYKRGLLLYGPAGCGKTSIIRMLCTMVIDRGGIVLSISDINKAQSFLLKLREIEPERAIMTIFEDIEGMMEKSEDASDLLSFLDGEKQLDNIVHLATTNKPDILEDRLLRRPGRFDLVIGLNPPTELARTQYVNHVVKALLSEEKKKQIVHDTEGMGFAHIRELTASILCLDLDYDLTLKRLKGNIKDEFKMPKVGQKSNVGFTLGFTPKEEE